VNGDAVPVTIQILDKEYMVSCPADERAGLIESAKYLDARMREVREGGKIIGTERVAVMTALNIIHELLVHRRESDQRNERVSESVERLHAKIDGALSRRAPEEPVD